MNGMFARMGQLCVLVFSGMLAVPAHAVFINEIHYDNSGADSGEAVELAGAAGLDLSGWSLVFYNGSDGSPYKTESLSGIFADMQAGVGVLSFSVSGIQNGASDGIALVNAANSVEQFLSYEGTLLAMSGAAAGMNSVDIGVAESEPVPAVGYSLQLVGSGSSYADFVWQSAAPSNFGAINAQQSFLPATTDRLLPSMPTGVPAPPSLWLLVPGLLGLRLMRRASRRRVERDVPAPA